MALIKSPYAVGTANVMSPCCAYETLAQTFIVDVPAAGFASGDILELAILPAFARIIDAKLLPVGTLGSATVDVGLMSGVVGEDLNPDGSARTVGNEMWAGAALSAVNFTPKIDCLLVAPSDRADRSIGVKFNAAVTYVAGSKLGIQLVVAQ